MMLPIPFYQRDTVRVAEDLLGKVLCRQLDSGEIKRGIIVETEAYLGLEDPACHSFGGRRTNRTEPLFMAGGHSYVYFIYGMYNCFNVVTREAEIPEAVLIRALQPLSEIDDPHDKSSNGPGKLCRAFNITREHNKLPLNGAPIWIEDQSIVFAEEKILASPRIGIDGTPWEVQMWPLRFFVKDNPHVSRHTLNKWPTSVEL